MVLSGEGKCFSAGIDFADFAGKVGGAADSDDAARKTKSMYQLIVERQDKFTALERVSSVQLASIESTVCSYYVTFGQCCT